MKREFLTSTPNHIDTLSEPEPMCQMMLYDISVDIGQTEIATGVAVGDASVVKAEQI